MLVSAASSELGVEDLVLGRGVGGLVEASLEEGEVAGSAITAKMFGGNVFSDAFKVCRLLALDASLGADFGLMMMLGIYTLFALDLDLCSWVDGWGVVEGIAEKSFCTASSNSS